MKTILVLEDDQPTRRALVEVLVAEMGVEVIEAGSVAEAQRLARTTPIDLLLADLLLPDGDALLLMDRLRADPEVPGDLQVVIVTGAPTSHERRQEAEAQGMALLPKPADYDELLTLVRAALARREGGAA